MDIEIIREPGGYGDGPAYLRVHRAAAGVARPVPGYPRTITGPLSQDREHHYIGTENSHSAFALRRWLQKDGVPADALAIVRVRGGAVARARMSNAGAPERAVRRVDLPDTGPCDVGSHERRSATDR